MKILLNVGSTLLWVSFLVGYSFAQDGNDLLGTYWTPDRDGQIQIYQQGGSYYGKLIWGKTDQDKDVKNPNPSLRNRVLKGIVLFKNFSFEAGSKTWKKGIIYNPEDGKNYDAVIWKEDGNLKVRGYIGFSLFGVTKTFARVE
ncbi:MAG: DUF2147 domain-containing protein [Bacteroidota bacterium]